jgi:TetR/AcrR family transcriptional repressor of mexJK operon
MTQKKSGRPVDTSKDKAIIDAARELLFESGPLAVTMEGVAAKSNVSKGTLYSRYANRHELIKKITEVRLADITLPIANSPQTRQELKTDMVEFVEQLTNYLTSNDHLKLMEALALPSKVIHREKKNIFQNGPQQTHIILANYLETATQTGLIQCNDPEDSAELLLGMMMGLDLVRAWYGIPLKLNKSSKRGNHALSIVTSFLTLLDCDASDATNDL